MQEGDQPDFDRGVAPVREQLGEEAFNALQARGRAMSLEQAVEYALKEVDND